MVSHHVHVSYFCVFIALRSQGGGGKSAPLDSRVCNALDVEFHIDGTIVHVLSRSVNQGTYNDFFIRHINKLKDVSRELRAINIA